MKKQKGNLATYKTEALPMSEDMVKECEPLFGKSIYSKKFPRAAKHGSLFLMLEMMEKHPGWNRNQVVGEVIKGLNPEFSNQLLIDIFTFLTERWEIIKEKDAIPA